MGPPRRFGTPARHHERSCDSRTRARDLPIAATRARAAFARPSPRGGWRQRPHLRSPRSGRTGRVWHGRVRGRQQRRDHRGARWSPRALSLLSSCPRGRGAGGGARRPLYGSGTGYGDAFGKEVGRCGGTLLSAGFGVSSGPGKSGRTGHGLRRTAGRHRAASGAKNDPPYMRGRTAREWRTRVGGENCGAHRDRRWGDNESSLLGGGRQHDDPHGGRLVGGEGGGEMRARRPRALARRS